MFLYYTTGKFLSKFPVFGQNVDFFCVVLLKPCEFIDFIDRWPTFVSTRFALVRTPVNPIDFSQFSRAFRSTHITILIVIIFHFQTFSSVQFNGLGSEVSVNKIACPFVKYAGSSKYLIQTTKRFSFQSGDQSGFSKFVLV